MVFRSLAILVTSSSGVWLMSRSKARSGGEVAVHVATRGEVRKPRGLAPGKVTLARFKTMRARPLRPDEGEL